MSGLLNTKVNSHLDVLMDLDYESSSFFLPIDLFLLMIVVDVHNGEFSVTDKVSVDLS